MASAQNKTSPRKFSEKIALLNKKEAEGNAEFETIIKEVQATRSQSACGHASTGRAKGKLHNDETNADDRAGLEEVFENLIRCVGQYEQDIHESQRNCSTKIHGSSRQPQLQQQHHLHLQQAVENIMTKRSASAGLGLSYGPSNVCSYVQQNDPSSTKIDVCTATELNNNNTNHLAQFKSGNLAWQSHCLGHESTTCRARVTSFGSANDKITCVNNYQQARNPCEPNVTCNNCNQLFLHPSCDKSWQKSCSDPALHLVYTPIEDHQSGNLFKLPRDQDHNFQDNSNIHQPVEREENASPQLNSYLVETEAGIDCDKSAFMIDFLMSEEQDVSNCKEGSQMFTQDSSLIAQVPQFNETLDSNSLPYDNSMNILKDLPGINICTIEDESRVRTEDNDRSSKNSSLPDIAHLKFTGDENYDTSQQQTSAISTTLTGDPSDQDTHSLWNQPTSSQLVPFDGQRAEQSSCVYSSQYGDWCQDGVSGPLYAPRVNNLFSNSYCGLPNQGLMSNEELCNIIRSRSHNGIDHMAKQQRYLHQALLHNQALDQHRLQTGKFQAPRGVPIKWNRKRASPSNSPSHQNSMTSFEPANNNLNAAQNPASASLADNNEYLTYSTNMTTQFVNSMETLPIKELDHNVQAMMAHTHPNNNEPAPPCQQSLYAATIESRQYQQDNQQYPPCSEGNCLLNSNN